MADKYIVNSSHAVDLSSGQVVAPSEKLPANALDEKSDHDKRLLEEGVIRPLGEKTTESKKEGDSK